MSSPGTVDREVIFDEWGIPRLPARRLKGLLRDAYRELLETGHFEGMPDDDDVFGKAGSGPAAFRIHDAEMPAAAALRRFLKAMRDQPDGISRDEIVAHFSEVRHQTRIDFDSGAPAKDTLRASRTLRYRIGDEPVRFFTVLENVNDELYTHLERAAKALRQMGSSRTRGLGFVRCRLERTPEATATSAVPEPPSISVLGPAAMPFRIELHEAALLTSLEGDANSVVSKRYIPGSSIQGVIAQRLLEDSDFHRLMCSGVVRFLCAYPEIRVHGEAHRGLPVPHSVRSVKADESRAVNLAIQDAEEPLRRLSGWCAVDQLHSEGYSPRAAVSTTYSYHHERPADRRIGHAVGEQYQQYGLSSPLQAGALFAYEALSAGQVFHGAVLGPAEDLERIRRAIPSGSIVTIGRSRSAQYGGSASWTWREPIALESAGGEPAGWRRAAAEFETQQIIAVLLAPMIARNENGHAGPYFPHGEIAKTLGVSLDLPGCRSFARTVWTGRYLSHQALPRSQALALQAGSVFVLRLPQPAHLSQARFDAANHASYGLGVEEGFGRVAFWPGARANPHLTPIEAMPVSRELPLNAAHPAWELAVAVLKNRTVERTARSGRGWAADYRADQLSDHLIARTLHLVETRPLEDVQESIREFREGPAQKLKRIWIVAGDRRTTLFEFLCNALNQDPPSLREEFDSLPWPEIFVAPSPLEGTSCQEWRERLRRLYLVSGLRMMAWKNRESRRKR
jgi:CRISPR-associated protein Csx10